MPFSEFSLLKIDHYLVIKIASDRQSNTVNDLKNCTEHILQMDDVHRAEINLELVNYLGSADLGDLLILRNVVYKKFGVIPKVTGMSDGVRKSFEISNFHKLFGV